MKKKNLIFVLGTMIIMSLAGIMGCASDMGEQAIQPSTEATVEVVDASSVEEINPEMQKNHYIVDGNGIWMNDGEYLDLAQDLLNFCNTSCNGSVMVATDDEIIFAGGFQETQLVERM